jgi:diguanylate cyclase (GGDEF)-like protein/PAS domain S-box-containing protein
VPTNKQLLLYATVRDISARKNTERSLLLASQAFEHSHEGILIADKDHRIISANHALSEITGFPAGEMIGQKAEAIYAGLQDPAYLQSILQEINAHDHWQSELWGCHRDGHGYPFSLSVTAVRNADREIINYIAILTDVSKHKEAEEKMQHMAEHDALTGLPNRILLIDRMHQAIAAAQRNGTKLAILFLDLDRFKYINDSFGHDVGDKLLQTVAERLRKCVRSNDTVSRLGGDEFVVMLVDVVNNERIAHIAENILNAISVPYTIEGGDFTVTTSIGISTCPDDSRDIDTLLKNADTAMYHAKDSGANRYEFFNRDMNARIIERIVLENNLRRALKRDEFVLYYQPQMDIAGHRAVGAEALIRWKHPTFGLMSPNRFIPIAEECGLIIPIGDWVLRTACHQAKSWQERGIHLTVAVNLSVAQFYQKNLLQSVTDALQSAKLDPQYLELEITESILMDEDKPAIETLRSLRELGVKVSIDDFGTGFSSLSYLKQIPVDKLKIDQSFVQDLDDDAEDAAIVNAIIVMAKGLNLKVTAEGVETPGQFRFLQSHGCDAFQGYYSSRELAPRQFMEFLDASA